MGVGGLWAALPATATRGAGCLPHNISAWDSLGFGANSLPPPPGRQDRGVLTASVAVAQSPADRPSSALAGSPLVAAHGGGGVGGPARDNQCPLLSR